MVIRECTNKKKLFVLVANMKCQCTAMAHRADPQAHRGGRGDHDHPTGGRGGLRAAHHIYIYIYIYETIAKIWKPK